MTSPLVAALEQVRTQLTSAVSLPAADAGDITMTRHLLREVEQAIARLEGKDGDKDLISIVCHDLKDPLASIVMGAGFLKKTIAAEDASARRVVDAIARSADRMNQVVGDFHDLARLEVGRLKVDARGCDVAAVIASARPALEGQARERGVRLDVQLPNEPLLAICDRARLLQVLTKLVGNAVRFTPQEGLVTIRAARDEAFVRLTVADTGRGIGPDRIASIFDHGANARRTPRDGPGLGLAIVRGLVELQGGAVSVVSQLGEGSVFAVTFPAAS